MRTAKFSAALAAVVFLWGAPGAQGEEISAAQASVLAGSCFNCHGTDGRYGQDSIPAIASKPAELLRLQLLSFKADKIPDTTVMNRLSKGFTDAELDALARYFSAIEE